MMIKGGYRAEEERSGRSKDSRAYYLHGFPPDMVGLER